MMTLMVAVIAIIAAVIIFLDTMRMIVRQCSLSARFGGIIMSLVFLVVGLVFLFGIGLPDEVLNPYSQLALIAVCVAVIGGIIQKWRIY
jgi:hypothetical protein